MTMPDIIKQLLYEIIAACFATSSWSDDNPLCSLIGQVAEAAGNRKSSLNGATFSESNE